MARFVRRRFGRRRGQMTQLERSMWITRTGDGVVLITKLAGRNPRIMTWGISRAHADSCGVLAMQQWLSQGWMNMRQRKATMLLQQTEGTPIPAGQELQVPARKLLTHGKRPEHVATPRKDQSSRPTVEDCFWC